MNKYTESQRKNLKVWARRFNITLTEEHYNQVDKRYPGSTLVGPLTMVLSLSLKDKIKDVNDRVSFANMTAKGFAEYLRNEVTVTHLYELIHRHAKTDKQKGLYAGYGWEGVDLIRQGIDARFQEKARPSVVDVVLDKVDWE